MAPRNEEYERAAELRAALRQFLRVSEQVARAHHLTPQRYLLLLMIRGTPAARSTVTELSKRLQLAQSTVTELVSRAERSGLIWREPSPDDRRVALLRLTHEGERRLASVVTELGPEHRRLAAVVGQQPAP